MFRAQLLGDRGRNTTGIGGNILAGILAEMRDISRFDGVEKIQKLSGMGLAASSSGKHKVTDQDQPQRAQEATVLAVPSDQVGSGTYT